MKEYYTRISKWLYLKINIMRYVLIEEYPGSPKLGTIWRYDSNSWNDSAEFPNTTNPKNYPKHWQPVVEKDYNILSFKQNSKIDDLWEDIGIVGERFARKSGQMFCTKPYSLEEILNNPLYSIHSVKRLSDGEIFTIGDKVRFQAKGCSDTSHISKIIIENNMLYICSAVAQFSINYIEKLKQPLFKTEDGVGIYLGDKSWILHKNTWVLSNEPILHNNPNLKQIGECAHWNFSTKEAAEEYILINKPCLSLKDVQEIVALVKSKLK